MHRNERGGISYDKQDQCYRCAFQSGKEICPLLEALAAGVVYIADDGFSVKDCGFYERRKLEVVKPY